MTTANAQHSERPLPKVLIINDSPVARAVTAAVVRASGAFSLVGEAVCGVDGVRLARQLRPDLVLLDMHMPDINGVEVTRRLMAERPTRILVTSATIRSNTTYLFDALKQGALDYCHTPALGARPGEKVDNRQLLSAGAEMLKKMQTVLTLPLERVRPAPAMAKVSRHAAPAAVGWAQKTPPASRLPIVAIGCSTGGPTALCTLLAAIPRGLPAAFLVSQHIEREFTEGLAHWLGEQTGHLVRVASDGEQPQVGQVHLACGGRRSLTLTPAGTLRYESAAQAVYYPNINRMLISVAASRGAACCGVILTGLGDDGADGLMALKGAGGKPLVQDPATAAVEGMPDAVLRRGIVSHGQGLPDLARLITHWITHSSQPTSGQGDGQVGGQPGGRLGNDRYEHGS